MKKQMRLLRELSAQMKKQNISAYAASTAFFLFVSMVPMLILICAILPFTPLTEENLVTAVLELTPAMVDPVVESLIAEVYDRSAGVLSLAAIATLWSAGKGVMALMRGLNAINDVEENRNYFLVRLVSSFYTLVMLVVLILSLFIMVFGNKLVDLILFRIPKLQVVVSFLMNFRFLLVWVILTILFSAIYAYVPNEKLAFGEQVPGATFAAVVWSTFSWGFSLYVERGSYSIYGSLALIVIVMVWLYFCMYIVMIGAYLNRFLLGYNRESTEN